MIIDDKLKLFGIRELYSYQRRTIEAILDGADTFSIFPTGGGKSLCYQLPALVLRPKLTIVVSPLIALINDQVSKLSKLTSSHTLKGGDSFN